MRAIFKYPGAKWCINQWIIDRFPEQHHSYLEPFFGSGGVFFKKKRSPIETINDLDGDVINFFRWCVRDPEQLAKEIYFTPYARDVYENAFREVVTPETDHDSLRSAVMFAAKMMMGYGFRTNGSKVGFKRDIQGREAAYATKDWCDMPGRIMKVAERLRGVQIENRPAVQLIREFNFENVLIYADPPYVITSRSCKRDQYKHEMSDEDHEELLDVLMEHKGKVILSGYQSPLYNDRLKDWYRETIEARAMTAGKRQEVIWMNYEPPAKQMQIVL